MLDEKALKKLTKYQLIHILVGVIGIEQVAETWESTRHYQKTEGDLKCWDCESIEHKITS